jgi:hypothetical protein
MNYGEAAVAFFKTTNGQALWKKYSSKTLVREVADAMAESLPTIVGAPAYQQRDRAFRESLAVRALQTLLGCGRRCYQRLCSSLSDGDLTARFS